MSKKLEVKVVSNTKIKDKKYYPQPTKLPNYLRPLFSFKYITPEGLKNLDEYRYHGSDLSWISNNLGQPFWRKTVLLLPTYLAPNMVTLIGFLAIILNYLIMIFYCPSMDCDVKPLICFISCKKFHKLQIKPDHNFLKASSCFFIRQWMQLMENKLEELVAVLHWVNYLITVVMR